MLLEKGGTSTNHHFLWFILVSGGVNPTEWDKDLKLEKLSRTYPNAELNSLILSIFVCGSKFTMGKL